MGMRLMVQRIEMDGLDLNLMLQGLQAALNAPPPAMAAETAPAPKALPAPAKKRRKPAGRRPRKPAPEEQRRTRSITELPDFIRQSLECAPLTVSECVDVARTAGYDTDSKRMSALLSYQRQQNKIYRDDGDGKWHRALEAKGARR
jgi:hypothetical protein